MASFKTAAALLVAATAALPSSHGFTSPHVPSSVASSRSTVGPLHATDESFQFQRSLLEAQFANSNGATAVVLDDEKATDISPPAPEPVPAPVPAVDNTATLNSILRVAASTDRGQYAKPSQKHQVSQLISTLESNYALTTQVESSLDASTGTWELLYSNTQLFRSSPFFLAGRSTCKTPEEAAQYDWFCEMHRAALAVSTIGVVRQVITREGKLVNEFEVKVGAVPFLSDFLPRFSYSGGLPFTIDGAIVSTADATPTSSSGEWELFMDTVEIKGSNIPILRNLLDSDNVKLKSRDLSKVLEDNVDSYEVPKPVLRTVYIDETMRIVKDEDDNVFVYGKVSESEEPTDYSGVLPDLGVASLLEGVNDAITKVYL